MAIYKGMLDTFGVMASLACAVHCILLPLCLTTLPVMGIELVENRYLEFFTLLISVGTGFPAVSKGYKKFHRRSFVVWAFAIGITLMALGNLLPEIREPVLKLAGVSTVAFAHVFNYRLSKNISVCCDPQNSNKSGKPVNR